MPNSPSPFRLSPRSLAFKLYAILGLAVAAIVALSYTGTHVAKLTANAALHLSRDGLDGIVKAAELEVLIEQHRRIVEAAPAEVDRVQIAHSREALVKIEASIKRLSSAKTDRAASIVADELPRLTALADRVLFLQDNLALDSAADAVDVYQDAAHRIQNAIRSIRLRQQKSAETMVGQLTASAGTLVHWGTVASLVAMVILAPLGLLVLGDAARRLRGLWRAMYRLAHNDIHYAVPSRRDVDEIGDMARAVQVFKDNANALADKRGEVEMINRFLDIALNNMARGLSMFDADHRLVICNEIYRAMYNLPPSLTVRGTPWADIERQRTLQLSSLVTDGKSDGDKLPALSDLMLTRKPVVAHQTMHDGRVISIEVQPLEEGGWVAVHEDVTRQREAEAHITRLARHDALTGLSNRMVFREEIEKRFQSDVRPFALMLIDLDKFKLVNDTMGHPVGDALLEAVSERLRQLTRATDLVARLGGDEFAVLQDGATTADASELMASRLIDGISAPYTIQGQRIIIGASIGIARAPLDGATTSELFSNADLALYRAKSDGRGTSSLFHPKLKEAAVAERTLESDLKIAIAENQFELFYQPILDLASGSTVCCEGLLRWRHPTRGMISPMDFIPFAEASGLIVPIGRWALREACAEAVKWPAHVRVAVNLSAVQVVSGNLVDDLIEILSLTGLTAGRLELEVTETLLLDDEPATRQTLLKVRDLGVNIALDDFGTGYASLSYLPRFPFDKLKIDQMFVRNIINQQASTSIVRAVAALARSLDMVAVAEGVETREHLACVAAAGCTQLQGYLFSRPVPASQILDVIATARVPDLDDGSGITTASARP